MPRQLQLPAPGGSRPDPTQNRGKPYSWLRQHRGLQRVRSPQRGEYGGTHRPLCVPGTYSTFSKERTSFLQGSLVLWCTWMSFGAVIFLQRSNNREIKERSYMSIFSNILWVNGLLCTGIFQRFLAVVYFSGGKKQLKKT